MTQAKTTRAKTGTQAQTGAETVADTPQPPLDGGEDVRLFKRRSVLWPAKLKVGKHQFNCQVWNLSLGGARIRVDLPLEQGAHVVLAVSDRGEIPAAVVWHREEAMGLKFDVAPDVIKRMFADRLHVLGLDEDN